VHEATGPDLLDVLRGTASVDEALIQDPQSGAWILPIRDASNDIGDLLIGDAMIALIAALRQRFGLVVLDAAPVLPIADTRALAAMVDGVVMIVRWRTTADHAVRTALRLLPLDRVPLAGIVLSQVDIRKQAQYGYGDSAHYYASYKHYYT
jgi:succinoglycan biosynthesis transport protein ExoP